MTSELKKICNLTRERHFGHFRHFREDSFDQSQTLPEYRGCHSHQKSRKKLAIIMAIWLKLPFEVSKITFISILRKFDIFDQNGSFFTYKLPKNDLLQVKKTQESD